jgi:hypothetical protein
VAGPSVTVRASKQAGMGHEPALPVGIARLRRHKGAMWSQPGFMPLALIKASAGYGADFRRGRPERHQEWFRFADDHLQWATLSYFTGPQLRQLRMDSTSFPTRSKGRRHSAIG